MIDRNHEAEHVTAHEGPTMYDEHVTVLGINLTVDRIDRQRSDESDNVMAIFHEEQPFTWEFVQPAIEQALRESTGEIDFLDVGTGSGIFGILMAKHHGAKIVSIDKSPRAIEQAHANAAANGVELTLKRERYALDSVPERSAKVIGLYPPYHLYPESIADRIPQHARGGSDGQAEFRNQLAIANHHLADQGVIFFNQMCLGSESGPEFIRYIPEFIEGNPSITYTNVLAPMATREFLEGVYQGRHADYVEATSTRSPLVYYTVGLIRRDGKGEVTVQPHAINLKGRTWQDRIELHRQIASHETK